jgi:hypothetical protein
MTRTSSFNVTKHCFIAPSVGLNIDGSWMGLQEDADDVGEAHKLFSIKKNTIAAKMRKCVVSRRTNCEHCFTGRCASKLLKDVKFGKVLGEGVSGLVISGTRNQKRFALKIEMLNTFRVSMTKMTDFRCDNEWFKIPGVLDMVQKYYIAESKHEYPKHTWVHSTEDFNKEVALIVRLAEVDVCPKVYFHGVCENGLNTPQGKCDVGILAMEQYDTPLREFVDYVLKSPAKLRGLRILELDQVFQDLVLVGERASAIIKRHGDLHDHNIVLKLGSRYSEEKVNLIKVRLIDFGIDFERGTGTTIKMEIKSEISKLRKLLSTKLRRD